MVCLRPQKHSYRRCSYVIAGIFLLMVFAVYWAFWRQPKTQLYVNQPANIAIGDWVLRRGVDLDSDIIAKLSHSDYSHIGVVTQITPQIMVTHATTTEGQCEVNQVEEIALAEFAATDRARALRIVRADFLSAAERTQTAKQMQAQLGRTFRLVARHEQPVYCTTVLYESIRQVVPTWTLPWQTIHLPPFQGDYLFPQAFLTAVGVETIYQDDRIGTQ